MSAINQGRSSSSRSAPFLNNCNVEEWNKAARTNSSHHSLFSSRVSCIHVFSTFMYIILYGLNPLSKMKVSLHCCNKYWLQQISGKWCSDSDNFIRKSFTRNIIVSVLTSCKTSIFLAIGASRKAMTRCTFDSLRRNLARLS